jgi:hypothetical protein
MPTTRRLAARPLAVIVVGLPRWQWGAPDPGLTGALAERLMTRISF